MARSAGGRTDTLAGGGQSVWRRAAGGGQVHGERRLGWLVAGGLVGDGWALGGRMCWGGAGLGGGARCLHGILFASLECDSQSPIVDI